MNTVIPFRPDLELIEDVGVAMMERWPKAFAFPQEPLAVGLGQVMLSALASDLPKGPPWNTITYQQLAMAVDIMLEAWVSQPRYLAATRKGQPRVGLSGEPLGKVLLAEEEWARDRWRKAFLDGPLTPTPEQVQAWINTGQWAGLPGQVWARPKPPRP
jgi:sRNA-binding protein